MSCMKKLRQKSYLCSSSTNSTTGASKNMGPKMLHALRHTNLEEVNVDSSFLFGLCSIKTKAYQVSNWTQAVLDLKPCKVRSYIDERDRQVCLWCQKLWRVIISSFKLKRPIAETLDHWLKGGVVGFLFYLQRPNTASTSYGCSLPKNNEVVGKMLLAFGLHRPFVYSSPQSSLRLDLGSSRL